MSYCYCTIISLATISFLDWVMYFSDSNRRRGVQIEAVGVPAHIFSKEGGANKKRGGVHLGVIEVYFRKVVGHYLTTLFPVYKKNKGIQYVQMYLTLGTFP